MTNLNDVRESLAHQHEHLMEILAGQAEIVKYLRALNRKTGKIMTTVAELNEKLDAAMAKLTANTDALDGIEEFIATISAELAAVKQQLQDLIDAGGAPPELTEVAAKVDALVEKLDAQAIKEAGVTNTPDDPND